MENTEKIEVEKEILRDFMITTSRGEKFGYSHFCKVLEKAEAAGMVTDANGISYYKGEGIGEHNLKNLYFHFRERGLVYQLNIEDGAKYINYKTLTLSDAVISEQEFQKAVKEGGMKRLSEERKEKLTWINRIAKLDNMYVLNELSNCPAPWAALRVFDESNHNLTPGYWRNYREDVDKLCKNGMLFCQGENGEWKQCASYMELKLSNHPRLYVREAPGADPYTVEFDAKGNPTFSKGTLNKDQFAEFLLNEKPPVQKRPWGGAQFLRDIANGIRKFFRAEELPEYREHKEAMQAFQEKKNTALKKAGYQVEEAPQEEKPASKGVDYQKQAEEICQKVCDTLDLPAEDEKAKAFFETMKNAMSEKGNVAWGIRHFVQDTVKDAGGKQLLEKLYQDFDPQQADATKEVLTGFVAPKLGDAETAGEYRAYMSSELQNKQKQLWSKMDGRMASNSKETPLISEKEFDTEIKKEGFGINK